MGDLINLNRARKAKQRAAKAVTASANRAKFGRTKAEKAADAAETQRLYCAVEDAKLEP